VEREYGLGLQRTDLLVIWPFKSGCQEVVLELKLVYGDREKTIEKGLEQTHRYMDKCGSSEGYLLFFLIFCKILLKKQSFPPWFSLIPGSNGYWAGGAAPFDKNKSRTWDEKIFKDTRTFKEVNIGIYGM
jgi:hypothetical protein